MLFKENLNAFLFSFDVSSFQRFAFAANAEEVGPPRTAEFPNHKNTRWLEFENVSLEKNF